MYLLAQMATYLFLSFLLGVWVGYALWRLWGEREAVAKFNAAERKLAGYLARWEKDHTQGGRDGTKMVREHGGPTVQDL